MKELLKYADHNTLSSHLPTKYKVAICEDLGHVHFYKSKVEYIQNTSSGTYYINTGIKGNGKLKVECIFEPWKQDGGWNCVYGGRNSAGSNDFIYIYSCNSNNGVDTGYAGYYNQTTAKITEAHASTNVKHTIVQDRGTFILDGAIVKTFTNNTFTSTADIFIFDGSNNNTPGNYKGYFKLYSFKMWNDGILVRNMIPIRIGTTGYMYDKVSKQIFSNSGTGNFTLGPDIN